MSGNGKSRRKPEQSGNSGRAGNGKFVKGHKGLGGRPKSQRSRLMEQALDAALTPTKAKAIASKLVTLAESGEPWAVKEILDRSVGKPKESVSITGHFTLTDAVTTLRDRGLLNAGRGS